MICFCIALTLLYIGRSFFIPVLYGVFLAFLLKPIRDRYESHLGSRVAAILLTMVSVFLVLGGVTTFFVIEIADVMTEADDLVANVQETAYELLILFGEWFGFREREIFAMVNDQIANISTVPLNLVTTGLWTSTAMLANISLIVIYTFFFLLYSTALKNFLLGQFRGAKRTEGEITINEVQAVAKNYLGGMATVMLILGVLNSAGLMLIGVRFALVWGFLGAILAIIPYIGTFIGGMLPFLYATATTDTYWQPLAVVALYITVQSVEGNLITPKVVGNSVKINALAAIVSLIFGAFLWGIAGVILAIPLLAMIRVVLDHIDATKPLALLLSDELYDHSEKFVTDYNQDKFRIRSLLKTGRREAPRRPARSASDLKHKVSEPDAEVVSDPKTE